MPKPLSNKEIQDLLDDSDEFSSENSDSDSDDSGEESGSDNEESDDEDVEEDDEDDDEGAVNSGLWRNILGKDEQPPKIPFKPEWLGPSQCVAKCEKESDFFSLFFDVQLLQNIAEETNRFVREKIEKASPITRNSQWYGYFDVTVEELRPFLGLLFTMALNEKPNIQKYFSSEKMFRQDIFTAVFTRRRFLQIFRGLHLQPPLPNHDNSLQTRGQKVKNIVTHMDKKCRELFSPGENICVDESTIAFKGRVIFKCYNPQKPTKWGIRAYVLSCSATGYVVAFEVYFGSPTTEGLIRPDLPFTSRIVMHLLQKVQNDCRAEGRHLYTDRFYTGVDLASELLKMKTHTTGTVMSNRKNLPIEVKGKQLNKLKKGEIVAMRKNDTVVLGFKDKRPVLALTTYHGARKEEITRKKAGGANEQITKPVAIADYTAHMGGVDRADHYCASYNFCRRSKKWWRKIFFWTMEVAMVNGFILFQQMQERKGLKPVEHLTFRTKVADQLMGDWRVAPKRKRARSAGGDIERLNGLFHQIGKRKQNKDCVVCSDRKRPNGRRTSTYYCVTCQTNPTLCMENCYNIYHTVAKYR